MRQRPVSPELREVALQCLQEGQWDADLRGPLHRSVEGLGPQDIWEPPPATRGLWKQVVETIADEAVRQGRVKLTAECNRWLESAPLVEKEWIRVLIVDDDDLLRNSLKRRLPAEWEKVAASSGKQALSLIHSLGWFDVVVTDLDMPRMNGVDLLRTIQRHWPGMHRVLMSANVREYELVQEALDCRAAEAFWHKMSPIEELIGVVGGDALEDGCPGPQINEPVSGPESDSDGLDSEDREADESAEGGDGALGDALLAADEPPPPVLGRLKRLDIRQRVVSVMKAFADRYDWTADTDWYLRNTMEREPTSRERRWLQEELEGLLSRAARRKTP